MHVRALKMCTFIVVAFWLGVIGPNGALAQSASDPAASETSRQDASLSDGASIEGSRFSVRDVEWASVAIGSGSFLLNFRGAGPTLIWERFYWTTVSADFFAYQARKRIDGFETGMGFVIGQSFGYPWRFDPSGRQELRVGAELGFFLSTDFPLLARDDSLPDSRYTQSWLGLCVGPELMYLYHFHKYASLTVGLRSAFAVIGKGDHYPFPYLAGQLGLAF